MTKISFQKQKQNLNPLTLWGCGEPLLAVSLWKENLASSFPMTIFVSVLPKDVRIIQPQEPISVSRRAQLECRSSGSRPPATVTWWKRGRFMGKAPEEVHALYFLMLFD